MPRSASSTNRKAESIYNLKVHQSSNRLRVGGSGAELVVVVTNSEILAGYWIHLRDESRSKCVYEYLLNHKCKLVNLN